jgi:hypothetical protein
VPCNWILTKAPSSKKIEADVTYPIAARKKKFRIISKINLRICWFQSRLETL